MQKKHLSSAAGTHLHRVPSLCSAKPLEMGAIVGGIFRTHVWVLTNARVSPHRPRHDARPSMRARYGPSMESCVGQTKLSSQLANLSWSARHRGRPIDEDPPPSRTERISLTIQLSQIRSYHGARIKEGYRDGQVKEAIIKELPYWGFNYKYIHHQPSTGYAI